MSIASTLKTILISVLDAVGDQADKEVTKTRDESLEGLPDYLKDSPEVLYQKKVLYGIERD